jgi:uncharacterized protein (DUF58 family)
MVRRLLPIPATEFTKPVSAEQVPSGRYSLSPRERVRVRANHRSLATKCRVPKRLIRMPASAKSLTLDPKLVATLEDLSLLARGVVEGFLGGLHRSPFLGYSSEFASYRPYLAGDNLRYLDWKVWGRTDKFYVKQFEDDTNLNAQLLLDTSASMGFGTPDKFAYARALTAALAYLMVQQRDAPGLILFGSQAVQALPCRSQRRHLDEILAALGNATASGCTEELSGLAQTVSAFYRRGLAVVISDLLSPGEVVFELLRQLQRQGQEVLVFHIVAPEEADFDFKEAYEIEDVETRRKLSVHAGAFREEYLRRFGAFLAEARRRCETLEADYCLLRTDQPLEQALATYLEARMEV